MEYNNENRNGKTVMYGFATYPDVVMYGTETGKSPVQQLIFGDYINLLPDRGQTEPQVSGKYVYARSRGTNGWIPKEKIQRERVLEVNFIDIGQGDGCHVVTPDDRHLIIDAGQEDNMFRFLSWRFNLRRKANRVQDITAVLTHPDQDHYKGFQRLFGSGQLSFSKVYHNGIVERAGHPTSALGDIVSLEGEEYLSDVLESDAAVKNLLNDPASRGRKVYPNTLYKALRRNPNISFEMLHSGLGYVPGFGPDERVTLQVLGPVCSLGAGGGKLLRFFAKDEGKAKNGHSVSLMLTIGKLRVFLGGDLNIEAEDHLLRHYTGQDIRGLRKALREEADPTERERLERDLAEASTAARSVFQAHIAKACHHGSHHFTSEFLAAVNPLATVISSGDNESHSHPRPDALGSFGKHSRGERPLIFSTELSRSSKETIKQPYVYREAIKAASRSMAETTDPASRADLGKSLDTLLEKIERSVAVYGLISVRTDGERAIICQKLEKPRQAGQKWDIHELVYNPSLDDFEYKVKLGRHS